MAQFNLYDSLIDLSVVKDYCHEKGLLCHYAKNDVFVQQGFIGRYVGIVESGYFKYTVITSSGDESVVGFAFEGEIVADFYNSYNNIPSEVSIKAGADSTISQVRTNEARKIFNDSFSNNLSALNGALFSEIYSRYLELHRKTPTERYTELIAQYPQIIDTVSLRDIASYLLVTPVYLSRIRKNLAKKSGE